MAVQLKALPTHDVPRSQLGPRIEVAWIAVDSIAVDPAYQRTISSRQVNKIAREFDPYLLGTVLVSQREDGERYVLDGQHRVEALRQIELGNQQIPALIYYELTQAEEARIFAEVNKGRLYLPPQYHFRARLIAGDKDALELRRIVESYGFHLNYWKPIEGDNERTGISMYKEEGRLSAIGELQKLYGGGKGDNLKRVLSISRAAWGEDVVGLSSIILRGISIFINAYEKRYERERLIEVLQETSLKRLTNDGRDKGQHLGGRTPAGISQVIYERYNFHLGATKRLPQRKVRQTT